MVGRKWVDREFSQRLGQRLKKLRTDENLTQEKLADMLEVKGIPMTWTQLARIEKGQRSLRAIEAAEFADIFNVSVDSLLGRRARPKADLMHALRSALDAKEQTRRSVSSAERMLRDAANELAEADLTRRYAPLVADCERACKALGAAEQMVARVGDSTNPEMAAALDQGRKKILRQWLEEQENGE
jgi:transcriptional regulator with XRE-family HTH domain